MGGKKTYLLVENAFGYGIFERSQAEEVALKDPELQKAYQEFSRFKKAVNLVSFFPFETAADALENANLISESVLPNTLQTFLEQTLGSAKKDKITLGVTDPKLGSEIQSTTSIPCFCNETALELMRLVRMHFVKYMSDLSEADFKQSQLGLAHSYSRSKVKFNVNRSDNMIIQAIAILDQLDKDINTFAMRSKEWYGWHFPELAKLVGDNHQYAQCATLIGNKSSIDGRPEITQQLTDILGDEAKAEEVVAISRVSMGGEASELDMMTMNNFLSRVVTLGKFRLDIATYLREKMHTVAPNLATLIGEAVGARLISHAGSLTNLAKYPASTLQILGAEKALFRALKNKRGEVKTPKYGLIFHSSFIGKAHKKNKGRISRYLANKSSLACRMDVFLEQPSDVFGEALKAQVERRLKYYEEGGEPDKNQDVMAEAMGKYKQRLADGECPYSVPPAAAAATGGKKKKKRSHEEAASSDAIVITSGVDTDAPSKKKKKKKKSKSGGESAPETPAVSDTPVVVHSEGKKKKKKKKASE